MADKVVLVDTSILIDYYRKTDNGIKQRNNQSFCSGNE
jgi:hypothetical protein